MTPGRLPEWNGVAREPVVLATCTPDCRWLETREHEAGCAPNGVEGYVGHTPDTAILDRCGGNVKGGPGCSCLPPF